MTLILKTLRKHKLIVYYLFFGLCSTIINFISYYISYDMLKINNIASTFIAWILAVIFAFLTNKQFVFESKNWRTDILLKELKSFIGCRVLTGVIDIGFMYITVDIIKTNALIMKLVSNIIVTILNYIASKIVVFKTDNSK